jgi:DNA-binding NarL/FixJ family response regulator
MAEHEGPAVRVMVVDDTDHVREMLGAMLSVSGFEVVGEVADGEGAAEACDRWAPDVVVVDYHMAKVDGLEAARRIRSRRPDQTMILYSAFVDGELEDAAAEAGVALCVAKEDGVGALEGEIIRLTRGRPSTATPDLA